MVALVVDLKMSLLNIPLQGKVAMGNLYIAPISPHILNSTSLKYVIKIVHQFVNTVINQYTVERCTFLMLGLKQKSSFKSPLLSSSSEILILTSVFTIE